MYYLLNKQKSIKKKERAMQDKEDNIDSGTLAPETGAGNGKKMASKAIIVGLEDENEGKLGEGSESGGLSGKALQKKQEMELKMKKREEERLKKKEEEKLKKTGAGASDIVKPVKQLEKKVVEESILMQEEENSEKEPAIPMNKSLEDKENIKEEILTELMQPSRSRIEKNLSKETINFDDLPIKASQKRLETDKLDEMNEGSEAMVFIDKKENEGDAAAKRKTIEERMKKREEERKKKIEDAQMAKENGKGEGKLQGNQAKITPKGKQPSSELTEETDDLKESVKVEENENTFTLADEKPIKPKATLGDEKPIGKPKPSSSIPFDEAPLKGSSHAKDEKTEGGKEEDENAEKGDKLGQTKARANPVTIEDERPLKGAKKSNIPEEYPPGYSPEDSSVDAKPAKKKVVKKTAVTKKASEEEPSESGREEQERPISQAVADDDRPLKGVGAKSIMMSEYPEGYEHGTAE
jgi:hypothetical protein